MAVAPLNPRNGAVAIKSGTTTTVLFVMDFAAFNIEANQSVENVTAYGTGAYSKNVGNATPDMTIGIQGFAQQGIAATGPLTIVSTNVPTMNNSGNTVTLTLDTALTYSGLFVTQSISISHARLRGSVPISMSLKNAGDIVETWVTS